MASSSPLVTLLGETLLGPGGEGTLSTAKVAADNKIVVLYASASWCGPCRATTPQLANAYTKNLHKLGLEIVFMSSDNDEKSFKAYASQMPWPALPFALRDLKAKLSKQYKIRGIPTMVILDAKTAQVITTDGRGAIMSDMTGSKYPWIPEPLLNVLDKAQYLRGKDTLKLTDVSAEVVGLLWSASWCGPCQQLKKLLIPAYNAIAKEDEQNPSRRKRFEIIMISEDEGVSDFDHYRADMPWLALSFTDQQTKEALNERFKVSGIPHIVLLERDTGHIISDSAVEAIMSDPAGFPWRPRAMELLSGASAEVFSDGLVCVVFAADNNVAKANQTALEGHVTSWKADDSLHFSDISFVSAGSHPIAKKLVEIMGGKRSSLVVFDLPEQRVFVGGDTISPDAVKAFVTSVVEGKATATPLKR